MSSRYNLSMELQDHRPTSMYGNDLDEMTEELKRVDSSNSPQCSTTRSNPGEKVFQEPCKVDSVKSLPVKRTGKTMTIVALDNLQESWRAESLKSLPDCTGHSAIDLTRSIVDDKDRVQEIDRLCREELDRLERTLREKRSLVEGREDRLKEMLSTLDKIVRQVEEARRNAEDRFRRYVDDFLKIRARVLMLQDQWNQQRHHLNLLMFSKSQTQQDDDVFSDIAVRIKNRHSMHMVTEPKALSDSELKTSVTSILLRQVRSAKALALGGGSDQYLTETSRPTDRSSLYKLAEDETDLTSRKDCIFY